MGKLKHVSGGKFGGAHTSVIHAAYFIVVAAEKLPGVSKVIPSIIRQTKSKSGKVFLRIRPTDAGIRLLVSGNHQAQDIIVNTKKPEEVTQALSEIWNKKNRKGKLGKMY